MCKIPYKHVYLMFTFFFFFFLKSNNKATFSILNAFIRGLIISKCTVILTTVNTYTATKKDTKY